MAGTPGAISVARASIQRSSAVPIPAPRWAGWVYASAKIRPPAAAALSSAYPQTAPPGPVTTRTS